MATVCEMGVGLDSKVNSGAAVVFVSAILLVIPLFFCVGLDNFLSTKFHFNGLFLEKIYMKCSAIFYSRQKLPESWSEL